MKKAKVKTKDNLDSIETVFINDIEKNKKNKKVEPNIILSLDDTIQSNDKNTIVHLSTVKPVHKAPRIIHTKHKRFNIKKIKKTTDSIYNF